MTIKLITVSAFTALLASVSLPASAVEPQNGYSDVPSRIVHFGDLDISTTAGARALHKRLSVAAYRVCEAMRPGPPSVERVGCQHRLIDAAVADVNNPALTALHTGKAIEITARR